MTPKRPFAPPKTIIPVASGKGGVGKSLFSANLAVALARMGHSTIAVDLDLGGANLHTCLGMPNALPGIGDLLKSNTGKATDLLVQTPIPQLRFLPGDGQAPFMANLSHGQRVRLIRAVRDLPARYVILDLGAGTSFNTLNLFGISTSGIVVTTFETTAVMNSMMFLRNFIFRMLSGIACKDEKTFSRLLEAFEQPGNDGTTTLQGLTAILESVNPALAASAAQFCGRFRPRIVFNMGDHPDELAVLHKITAALKNGLSMAPEYLGFLFHDHEVRQAAKNRETLLIHRPSCSFSSGMVRIAERVDRAWDGPMPDSPARLVQETRAAYTTMARYAPWEKAAG